MSNHKEKPPQVTRGHYIHLPQDSIAEEPSPPEHHDSTTESTPMQAKYPAPLDYDAIRDAWRWFNGGPLPQDEDDGRPYHADGPDFEDWDKRAKDALDEAMAEAEAQDDADEGVNPKDLLGIKKPNLFLVPPAAEIYLALAMQDGAAKYGPFNWREKKVKASIYVSACKRHINAWVDGEENAADSEKPHLAHALACLAIIVDAHETGNLADDRPQPGAAAKLIAKWTKE